MILRAPVIRFGPPSDGVRKGIQMSLANKLEGSERTLLRFCGLSNYLAIDTVRRRERACGRFIVKDDIVKPLSEALEDLGIACRTAGFRMVELEDRVPGTHHNGSFRFDNRAEGKAVFFFSFDPAFLEGAEIAEIHAQHGLVGELFGYPACCVDAYLAGDPKTADRTPDMVKHTGPFPAILNPAVQYMYAGLSLLFHFPCSAGCEASLSLAQHRLGRLMKNAPEMSLLEDLGRGITLYGESVGVALVTQYECIEPHTFDCEQVLSQDARVFSIFQNASSTRLHLLEPRRFMIGDRLFDAPHQFAAKFE